MKTNPSEQTNTPPDLLGLKSQIKDWAFELGFADIGFSDIDLSNYEARYFNWIGEQFHGDMDYMERHGTKRTRPNELEPGTNCVISVRMNYYDISSENAAQQLQQSDQAYISRYALGKDYHKILRKRLQKLAEKIASFTQNFQYRAFTDSAPVLERPLAEKAGLGFIGKNSLIIHPRAGSWFFLGELYCNLPIPADPPFEKQGCGPCTACIQECPTQAIVGDTVIDARRCISYLTIEYKGSIPIEFRPLIGNRIYGCDDCQLVCPWNKFTTDTTEPAFKNSQGLDKVSLIELWRWSEDDFLNRLQGSPIRRIGYAQWKRNLAVSLGNIKVSEAETEEVISALNQELGSVNSLVDEHIEWALSQLKESLVTTDEIGTQKTPRDKNSIKPFVAKKYYLPKTPKSKT